MRADETSGMVGEDRAALGTGRLPHKENTDAETST